MNGVPVRSLGYSEYTSCALDGRGLVLNTMACSALDSFNTALGIHVIYHYTVTHFLDPHALLMPTWWVLLLSGVSTWSSFRLGPCLWASPLNPQRCWVIGCYSFIWEYLWVETFYEAIESEHLCFLCSRFPILLFGGMSHFCSRISRVLNTLVVCLRIEYIYVHLSAVSARSKTDGKSSQQSEYSTRIVDCETFRFNTVPPLADF